MYEESPSQNPEEYDYISLGKGEKANTRGRDQKQRKRNTQKRILSQKSRKETRKKMAAI